MATTSKAGDILVWDMQSRQVLNGYQHEKKTQICNLAWNPAMLNRKEIAYCDCKGYLGLIENVTNQTDDTGRPAAVSSSLTDTASMMSDDVEFSISQIKKATGFITNEEDGLDVFAGIRPSSTMGIQFIHLKT